ncbi:hypothetical protein TcasGA2_TC002417 [Tribolium castaneum]|uniref:NAD(P)(+)--arginine ADP-ribosyltransferase n=1 Tax=Tribolium castaneum TaxID=7070 RepID=D6WII5_TRICA|nr:hypothetical protein TcasGA2_TC002417 [Tribolium castaneum]
MAERQQSDKRRQLQRYVGTQPPSVGRQGFQIDNLALNTSMDQIKFYLNQELATNKTYALVWNSAKILYANDVEKNKYVIQAPPEFYQAIIAYSFELNGFKIYDDFNTKSRQMENMSSWNAFPYKSLYCLLAQSVKCVKSIPDAEVNNITLYRGLNFVFPCQVNQIISFSQFASFTSSEKVAKEFTGNNQGTIFVIPPPVQNKTTLGIRPYSFFVNEEEVLVMAWSKFRVKRIIKEENKVILESVDNPAVQCNSVNVHSLFAMTERQNSSQTTQQRYVGTQAPFTGTQNFQIANFALKVNINDIRQYLAEELAGNETYAAVWNAAKEIFVVDVKSGRYVPHSYEDYYLAIIAYSYENQGLRIYADFNLKTRQMKNLTSWKAFPYKSLYCLLAQSVGCVESFPDVRREKLTIYRGLNLGFPCEVNQTLCFGQFTSFSTSESVAERFIGKSGTIFELKPLAQPKTTLGIAPYSFINNEEEVLVMAWSQFVVKEIQQNKVILESVENKAVKVP